MDDRLDAFEIRLQNIEKLLSEIDEKLDKLNKSCSNMDEHINFVESVYDTMKKPFSYILPNRIRKNVLYIK